MTEIRELTINNKQAVGTRILAPGGAGHPNMLVIACEKGYLMCGYLNLDTAEKFGDAAVVVGGSDFTDMLKNTIKGFTSKAGELGIREGMTGAEAAVLLN